MSECSYLGIVALVLLGIVSFSSISSAQYWFQSGAVGNLSSAHNYGAAVTIETVNQPQGINGSFGFWVGESLSNGAFIQAGYEIPNESGYFPSACTPLGCTGNSLLEAGSPVWFWEYFPKDYNGASFYGAIGADGSAGPLGTFNNYSFTSIGNSWYVKFNNKTIGNVSLGASQSGFNEPIGVAEFADAYTNNVIMNTVEFKNLEFYNGTGFHLVPAGYSYVEYGKNSETALPNL